MVGRDGVEDEVERARGRLHLLLVFGDDKVLGADLHGGLLLPRARRDGRHRVAHGRSQTDSHLVADVDVFELLLSK